MKKTIVIAGKNTTHIDDFISETLEREHKVYQAKTEDRVEKMIQERNTDLVILCMSDDNNLNCNLYKKVMLACMRSSIYKDTIPIIAIGKEEEYDFLASNTMLKKTSFVNIRHDDDSFMEKIDELLGNTSDNSDSTDEEDKNEEESKEEKKIVIKKDILVIDDDIKVLKLISSYLEDDYNVTIAKSGISALKYLKKNKPHLILLDYMMPGETGAEVFKDIRTYTSSKKTPIMFLTGVADSDIVKEILMMKPQGYILKPVTKEDLMKKIKPILNQ